MYVLVANLGSTSFKYRLFDMTDEKQIARGGAERIGSPESACFVEIGGKRRDTVAHLPDHAAAVREALERLCDPGFGCLQDPSEVSAIGFKAVHGGRVSGVQRVTPDVLDAMAEMNATAPAHNPPYIAAMKLLGEKLPEIPLVAAFETGFHLTIPPRLRRYAIPEEWAQEFKIERWGFHGASHRFISQRIAELTGKGKGRVVSCHLGGSSSLTAIRDGKSVMTTMGMSPQSGLPQNNRVGDFDLYALPILMERTGKSLDQILTELGSKGGLLGVSGVSGDIRDVEAAAKEGNDRAQLALDVYVSEIRRNLGGMLVEMGGIDVIVFTGGIGENGVGIRRAVCANLEDLGIRLDETKNAAAKGEGAIHADDSRTEIWIVPTNEELVVARQTRDLLRAAR
ncbi:MAG TPA: acetate/propionate family kinase [Pirellulaceae bacterium]|jgi:acetate kinase|nr:acetate/propionate family kinase [Pirellulaceae bacterium]